MRRLARYAFTALSLLSLLMCVAVCVLWRVSYSRVHVAGVSKEVWPERDVWRNRFIGLRMVRGHWLLGWGRNDFHLDRPEGIVLGWGPRDAERFRVEHPGGVLWRHSSFDVSPPPMDNLLGLRGFDHNHREDVTPSRTDISNHASMPVWPSVAALLVLPVVSLVRTTRRRRRTTHGRCQHCGYDLRASPGRCPECGAAAAADGPRAGG
jgi:hypothetical protein